MFRFLGITMPACPLRDVQLFYQERCEDRRSLRILMSTSTAAMEGKRLLKKFMLRTAVRVLRITFLLVCNIAAFFRLDDTVQVLRLYRSLYRCTNRSLSFVEVDV
jgi:hypothetical protein